MEKQPIPYSDGRLATGSSTPLSLMIDLLFTFGRSTGIWKHLPADGSARFLVTVSVTFPISSEINLPQVPERFNRAMFNKFYAGNLVDMTEGGGHFLPFLLITFRNLQPLSHGPFIPYFKKITHFFTENT